MLARFKHEEGRARSAHHAAAFRACRDPRADARRRDAGSGRARSSRSMSGCSALSAPPTSACVDWPERMRAAAVSTAETPEPSSPMKVRDEPVTLWTMEILPASRLESCARNSVGLSSVVSFSLSRMPRSVRVERGGEDRRVDRLVALAAGRRHHHVHGRAERVVALHARIVERQPGAHRCRAAARSPSGAGRRAWGSAGPSRFPEADGPCRAESRVASTTGCGPAAVSFCQCASLPSPSEETRPMPVMTTSRGLMPRQASPVRRPWPPPARRSWRRGSSSGNTLPSRPCRH